MDDWGFGAYDGPGLDGFVRSFVRLEEAAAWSSREVLSERPGMHRLLAEADRQLAAYADDEAVFVAKLRPETAAGYRRLQGSMAPLGPYGRVAQAALQRMLRDQHLLRARPLRGAGSLLDQLSRLVDGPLAAGVVPGMLLAELVLELDAPCWISQRSKSTCVATVMSILLAIKKPAEYARLVAGLASPAGTVTLCNGDVVRRARDWTDPEDGGRTTSGRLLWPALMEYGNGALRYDNVSDQSGIGSLLGVELARPIALYGGLTQAGATAILRALSGRNYRTAVFPFDQGAGLREIAALVGRGELVPAAVNWEGEKHEVLVTGVAGGQVTLINPWGLLERFDAAELESRLFAYTPLRPVRGRREDTHFGII